MYVCMYVCDSAYYGLWDYRGYTLKYEYLSKNILKYMYLYSMYVYMYVCMYVCVCMLYLAYAMKSLKNFCDTSPIGFKIFSGRPNKSSAEQVVSFK